MASSPSRWSSSPPTSPPPQIRSAEPTSPPTVVFILPVRCGGAAVLRAGSCEGSGGSGRAGQGSVLPPCRPPFVSDGTSSELRRRPLRVCGEGSFWQWVEASRRILASIALVPTATDQRSPASMACRRPLLVRSWPRRSGRCVPFQRLRFPGVLAATPPAARICVPFWLRLAGGAGHHPPSSPAFYLATFPTLSTLTACCFQSSCFFGRRCSPTPSLREWQSTGGLSFSSSDPDLAAMGLLGLRPGENHARLADAGSGDTRDCRFPSWRRCHGLYSCPSSSTGGNPRSGYSDRMATAS